VTHRVRNGDVFLTRVERLGSGRKGGRRAGIDKCVEVPGASAHWRGQRLLHLRM
jgi:hypothetical protein